MWNSKFRSSFSHTQKRVWKTQNSQNGSFSIRFYLNWSKLVICHFTCIPAPPYCVPLKKYWDYFIYNLYMIKMLRSRNEKVPHYVLLVFATKMGFFDKKRILNLELYLQWLFSFLTHCIQDITSHFHFNFLTEGISKSEVYKSDNQ